MEEKKVIVKSDTVYDVITRFPEIKEKFFFISPKFKKLGNPLLFNTVAKTATIEKAAEMGGIYLKEFLYQLNEAIGMEKEYLAQTRLEAMEAAGSFILPDKKEPNIPDNKPEWLSNPRDFPPMDVRSMQVDPFETIYAQADALKSGEGFCLIQKFEPFPLIAYLESRGFEHFTDKAGKAEYHIYFKKK